MLFAIRLLIRGILLIKKKVGSPSDGVTMLEYLIYYVHVFVKKA